MLTRLQFLSYSKKFPSLKKPDDSLQFSQVLTTCLYPEPD